MTTEVGTGLAAEFVGMRLRPGEGLAGVVWETGRPLAVEDYDTYLKRSQALPMELFGATVGVPLLSAGKVLGVIGLCAGPAGRVFTQREIEVLTRVAQLASIALTNARLFQAAEREVDERRRTEALHREEAARYRRLCEAGSEPIALVRDGRVVDANDAFCALVGVAHQSLVGMESTLVVSRLGSVTPTALLSQRSVSHHDGAQSELLSIVPSGPDGSAVSPAGHRRASSPPSV